MTSPYYYGGNSPVFQRKLAPNSKPSTIQPPTPGGVPPAQTQTPPPAPQSAPQGSSLPYAGVYLEQQNTAQKAWENAQTQLLATRNALYHRHGLLDTGAVDPYSQYGDYQTMLSREGGALDSAREDAIGRGLGGSGLANQAQSKLRYAQGAEQLDFKNQVLGEDSDYRTALAQALASKNSAFLGAEEQANQDALQKLLADGYFNRPSGGNDTTNTDDHSSAPTPPTSKDASDALSRYLANQNVKKKSTTTRRAE